MQLKSLALIAAMLAKKYNMSVISGGSKAYTTKENGRYIINIPAVTEDNEYYNTLVNGYIDHEAGHALSTDWDVWTSIAKMGDFYAGIGNCFEDAFVERSIGRMFPGCRFNLRNLEKLLIIDNMNIPEAGTPQIIQAYTLFSARHIDEHKATARERLEQTFPGLADELDPVLEKVDSIQNTKDTMKLVKESKRVIEKYFKDNPSKSCDLSQGSGTSEDSSDSSGSNDNSSGSSGNANSKNANGFSTDIGSKVEKLFSSSKVSNNISTITLRNTVSTGRHGKGIGDETGSTMFNMLPANMEQDALRVTSALDSQLYSLLQHKILNREGRYRYGRLDFHKLHRLAVNDPRIFNKRTEKEKLNTEVCILMDASGSMGGTPAEVTSEAVYALCGSLRKLKGVRSAVYAFAGYEFVSVLDFGETFSRVGFNMAQPNGGTPGGAALHQLLQRFSPDPEVRKLAVVMTDGAISDETLWKLNLDAGRKAGIEFAGIGIMSDDLFNLMPAGACNVIQNINELPGALFNILRERLV